MINSVCGKIPSEELGLTLMHEHILCDDIGADYIDRNRWNKCKTWSDKNSIR